MNDRAIVYRRKYNIPQEWGTAVNVQAMVYGNTGDQSGSGVAFTRDPATGEKVFYGEFLINAQGEDVVAGVRTPEPVARSSRTTCPRPTRSWSGSAQTLETHFKDMQDFEFTIQDGKVYMLQTRNGKRTGVAAVRIAVEMVKEKLIDWQTAIAPRAGRPARPGAGADLRPRGPQGAPSASPRGLPAGPGAACGRIYFNAERAVDGRRQGRDGCCWSASRPPPRTCAA